MERNSFTAKGLSTAKTWVTFTPPLGVFDAVVLRSNGLASTFPHHFLFIEHVGEIKSGWKTGRDCIRRCRALKPLCHPLLAALLTERVKERAVLRVTMFILKHRSRLLTAGADPVPEVVISGITGQAP